MKTTLKLFLISGALALLDASHLEGATNVAVSSIPPITTVGTNDLLLLDSYNGPGSYTTHTITWSNLQKFIDLSVATFSNKLAASFMATLNGAGTNPVLRSAGMGIQVTNDTSLDYALNPVPRLNQNFLTGTNYFLFNFGDAVGSYGHFFIDTGHGNEFGGGENNPHNTEHQWDSPGHVAIGPGFGYGAVGHIQFGIGNVGSPTDGGVWTYMQNQPHVGDGPAGALGWSGAFTWLAGWKESNSVEHAMNPGIFARALSVAGSGSYALDFFGDLGTFSNGTETWNPANILPILRLQFGSSSNLTCYSDAYFRQNTVFGTGNGQVVVDTTTTPIATLKMGQNGKAGDLYIQDGNTGSDHTFARFGTNGNWANVLGFSVNKAEAPTNAALEVNGAAQSTKYFLTGTQTQIVFGASTSVPGDTSSAAKWVQVSIQGDANSYAVPLYLNIVYDTNALNFFDATGITNVTQKSAVNQLVLDAKNHGWWTNCDAIYPFVGGTSNSHAWNLRNTNFFKITWHGTVMHDTNGITGNASSGYGDTAYNFRSSGLWTTNSAHYSFYVGTTTPVDGGLFIGGFESGGPYRAYVKRNGSQLLGAGLNNDDGGLPVINSVTDYRGPILCSRTNSGASDTLLFLRSTLSNNGLVTAARPPNLTCFLLDANVDGSGPNAPTDANLRGATIGNGITSSQWTQMRTDWDNYENTLSRKVP